MVKDMTFLESDSNIPIMITMDYLTNYLHTYEDNHYYFLYLININYYYFYFTNINIILYLIGINYCDLYFINIIIILYFIGIN